MDLLIEILSWFFIVLGSLLLLIGSFGLIRLPDFWARMHASSVSDTGGVLFVLIGMMLQSGSVLVFIKLLVIGVFILISSPTASHAIANAAFVNLGYNRKKKG